MTQDPRRTILVVDDNEDLRECIGPFLGTLGLSVRVARDGAAALEVLRAGGVDLLLSDMSMPGMTGIELFHAARTVSPGTKLVLMTGLPYVHREAAMALGALVLGKPFTAAEIREAVRRLCGGDDVGSQGSRAS